MRAAIYNPYLDSLGGGERYSLAFAQSLQKLGYDVFVEWKTPSIKSDLEARFGVDLSNIAFIKNIKKGEGFDLCFWVSDGSIPLLRARKNYLHFQFPFSGVDGRSLFNRMKMFRINGFICNSEFTKKVIDKEFGVKSKVLYPPVDTSNFRPKVKQNIVLSVARFSQLTQAKNQHILVEVFRKVADEFGKEWKLILAGGTEIGANEYVGKLKKLSRRLPVEIFESPSFSQIKDIYGKSKIFWSASGFGINETKEPKKVEHFGIAVVEAMSAGAVPVIYNAGGHKEILTDGVNGYLWDKKNDLFKATKSLILDKKKLNLLSKECQKTSQNFSYDKFTKTVQEIIS